MREGWINKKLGDVCQVSAGQGAPQGEDNYSDVGTPFVKAGNLVELINGKQESDIQKVSDEVAKAHRLVLHKTGSVVFAKSGMSCMKGHVYTLKNDCYVVSHLAILQPRNISSAYLNYYLQYHKPNNLIKDEGYPSISLKDIENSIISLPSNIEQENRVVSELDKINELISLKKEQLKDYDNLAQSIFYEMFGDPVENEKGWEVKKLGNFCEIGTGSTPSRKNKEYYEGSISWVKSTEVSNCVIDSTEEHISEIAIAETNCTIYPKGTILIAMYGQGKTRGQIAILNIEATTNQAVAAILPSELCEKFFLYHCLHLMYDNIRSMARGGNQANLNLAIVRSINIILPPLPIQQLFAKRIELIEKQKAEVQRTISDLETLLASRMQYWFD